MNQLKIAPARSQFSILRQICNFIPQHLVSKIARITGAEDKSRTFSPWSHVVTRVALGATRGVLVRHLVGEGILIAALGTAGAVFAFSWIGGIITQFASWWR